MALFGRPARRIIEVVKPWHLRHVRMLAYGAAAISAVGVSFAAAIDAPTPLAGLIAARQLYGLWSLGLLIGTMMIGPLAAIIPQLPFRVHLMAGRRALGVSAFAFAVIHTICYVLPVLVRDWSELYTPGTVWICGLFAALAAIVDMTWLAITSRDAAVKRLGGRRWKRVHRTTYLLLPVVVFHALANGSDFGINRPPDVRGPADFGALITFVSLVAAWIVLFELRRRRVRLFGKPSPDGVE